MFNNKPEGGFFEKLKRGLTKTKESFVKNVDQIIFGEKVIDASLFDELEEILITADMGPSFTYDLIEEMKDRVRRKELNEPEVLKGMMKEHMLSILKRDERRVDIPRDRLYSIIMVGVNGTGKTTTIRSWRMISERKGGPSCSLLPTPSGPPLSNNLKPGANGLMSLSSSKKWGPIFPPSFSMLSEQPNPKILICYNRYGREAPYQSELNGRAQENEAHHGTRTSRFTG